jgi:hypothetical protein
MWCVWLEFEVVLNISQLLTKMAQYEKLYNGGYGAVIKKVVYNNLRSDTISVIDMENIGVSPKLPRKLINVEDLSVSVAKCLDWAILEFECCFLGNTTENKFTDPGKILQTDQELLATILDLWIIHVLDREEAKRAMHLLEIEYINFLCNEESIVD